MTITQEREEWRETKKKSGWSGNRQMGQGEEKEETERVGWDKDLKGWKEEWE